MKKLHYALLTIALLLPAALFAQEGPGGAPSGQGGPGGRHSRHMPTVAERLDRLSKSLNLTDDQKPQVKSILEEQDAKMHEIMNNSSASREDNMAKMHAVHESSNAKIRALLTDEQKSKFDKMEAEQHKHMGEGRGGQQGAPPPPQQ